MSNFPTPPNLKSSANLADGRDEIFSICHKQGNRGHNRHSTVLKCTSFLHDNTCHSVYPGCKSEDESEHGERGDRGLR